MQREVLVAPAQQIEAVVVVARAAVVTHSLAARAARVS